MRDRLRKLLWSICWDIGDRFLWYAMRLQGPPDETWTRIDIHANCQPKHTGPVIRSSTIPTWTGGTSTTADWN